METSVPKRLDEVTLMRCVLALLIVFMHAFTCFNHSWQEPAGYVDVPLYKWLSRISFAFTLEAFVFISGYLYAYQRITLHRVEQLGTLIINKLKRLILPSILFSALYFAIFYQYKGSADLLYNLVNGCGHMWFLPMLFWCFIGDWLLEQIKIKDVWKIILLIVLNLSMVHTFPLRLSQACSYMFYFYVGWVTYKHSTTVKATLTRMQIAWGWVLFLAVFAVLRPLCDSLVCTEETPKLCKFFILSSNNACQLIYSNIGVMLFYFTTSYYIQRHQLNKHVVKFAACCLGIYLFQQFILQLLYYKTSFPIYVGPYWLPWCGFIIATIVSYCLTVSLLRTKLGRFIIG